MGNKSDPKEEIIKERASQGAPTFHTAPFELLYQTSPGRGLVAPTDAILIIDPPIFCLRSWGITADVPKKTPLTLTSKHLSKSASVTSSVGCNER